MDRIQILSIMVSLFLLAVIIYLVRKNKLKIQYSLLWILAGIVILFFSSYRQLLEKIAALLDVYYPPSLLFLLGLFFTLMILLHFSLIISKLFERNKILTQELMLLKHKLENYESKESRN